MRLMYGFPAVPELLFGYEGIRFFFGRTFLAMGLTELVLLSFGLASDAFSVSVCKGLCMKKIDRRGAVITALFFGFFQFLMPIIGFLLGVRFEAYMSRFSHWVAFVLLGFIGGKMIFEAIKDRNEEKETSVYRLDIKELTLLAIATSIDALAVGIVFAAEQAKLLFSVSVIGAITFAVCLAGVVIGNRFGSKYDDKAQIAGGAVLIVIGLKLLLDGLGVI